MVRLRLKDSRLPALLSAVLLVTAVCLASASDAKADDNEARNLLKGMSDYMAGQTMIAFEYDSDLEIVSSDLQKLTFASSGTVSLSRPDKIRVTRTGGFADVEMVYDGKELTILGKNLNQYAKVASPGTVDELVDNLRVNLGIEAPGADLLLSNVYEKLTEAVVDVKDLGSGVIGGVECNHLAFRNASVDWEIWIAIGEAPYPCRYVVTSKLTSQAPQYRVEVRNWKAGADVAADDFSFKNPDSAAQVDVGELQGVDELPDFASQGGAQ